MGTVPQHDPQSSAPEPSEEPPPYNCHGREWASRRTSHSLSPSKGVSVTHRRRGDNGLIRKDGNVRLEGTNKNEISVLVDLKSTSPQVLSALEVSVDNDNEVTILVFSSHE